MSDCVHHWLVPAPDSGTPVGHCKKCGQARAFKGIRPDLTPEEMSRNAHEARHAITSSKRYPVGE